MIIEQILTTIEGDAAVLDVRVGPFLTAVSTERGCGLSSCAASAGRTSLGPPVDRAGSLVSRTAVELARLSTSGELLPSSIGIAALNALIKAPEPASCSDLDAAEVLMEKGRGKRVALVGHFPFVPKLRQAVEVLWILDKGHTDPDMDANQLSAAIAEADVVVITGSALVSGTFDDLVRLPREDAFVALIGPSTPLTPVLFDFGVDLLSGAVVEDAATVLTHVSQAATYPQLPGIRRVTMLG